MSRCPITYEWQLFGKYTKHGLRKLNSGLSDLKELPFNPFEQIREVQQNMSHMSLSGGNPKLCAQLSVKDQTFKLVDKHGSYILKPALDETGERLFNEDLTMHLAELAGIEVPLHGLIYGKEKSMLYFIRRFDRKGRYGKIHTEDFAQIAGVGKANKYDYSLEKIATLLDKY